MIKSLYFWLSKKVDKVFLFLLMVMFYVLLSPVLAAALITYFTRAPFYPEPKKRSLATKIAKWRFAEKYTDLLVKVTGYKF